MKNRIYLGVQFFNPQEGVLGNGGWGLLNTIVDQRTRRHKRPGNIQKPLGELRPSYHQSRFNIAICMEQHGPVNYVLGLSSHLTGWVSLLCSLFEGKGHAFFNSTGALYYSPCLLALLSSRALLSITRLTGFKCIKDGHAAQWWLGHTSAQVAFQASRLQELKRCPAELPRIEWLQVPFPTGWRTKAGDFL